jgi:hypothetical protein
VYLERLEEWPPERQMNLQANKSEADRGAEGVMLCCREIHHFCKRFGESHHKLLCPGADGVLPCRSLSGVQQADWGIL